MDILYIPALERFAANMPFVRGLSLKGNPSYPRLNAYYEAMDALPSYQEARSAHAAMAVKSDTCSTTQNRPIFRKKKSCGFEPCFVG